MEPSNSCLCLASWDLARGTCGRSASCPPTDFPTFPEDGGVDLDVYAFNPRARHVYERCGFVYEGRKRAALKFDGAYVDAILMSMLRPDWEPDADNQSGWSGLDGRRIPT
jgi:hypothetical protein